MAVWISHVHTQRAAVCTTVDCDRLRERYAARRDESRETMHKVVAGDAHVCKPDIGGTRHHAPARRGAELEQLDPWPYSVDREVHHPYVNVRLADDRLKVPTLLFLRQYFLHSERVAPEPECPLEV